MTAWSQIVAETARELAIQPPNDDRSAALGLIRATSELAPYVADAARAQAVLLRWLQLVHPTASPEVAAAQIATAPAVMYTAWLATYRHDAAANAALPPETLMLGLLPLLSPGCAATDPAWRYVEGAARQLHVPTSRLHDLAGWLWGTATTELTTRVAGQLDAMAEVGPLAAAVVQAVREISRRLHTDRAQLRSFSDARSRCREQLPRIRAVAYQLGISCDGLDELERYVCGDAYRVAVLGEFKRGKSTLIGALLEQPSLLPAAVLPCTNEIVVLRHGAQLSFERWSPGELAFVAEEAATFYAEAGQAHLDLAAADEPTEPSKLARWRISVPSPFLAHATVELIDTPGTNEDAGRTLAARLEAQRADAALVVLEAPTCSARPISTCSRSCQRSRTA